MNSAMKDSPKAYYNGSAFLENYTTLVKVTVKNVRQNGGYKKRMNNFFYFTKLNSE
jgi:hypothetical protein